MAVVIRLQGLRITAGSEDIRRFFTGLRIPDGGVHIIGGELEEAFIIFASDEDARRAITRSGGCIKGAPVNLLLSSKSEMQKVLEESTRKPEAVNRRHYKEVVKKTVVEGRPTSLLEGMKVDIRRGDNQNMGNRPPVASSNDSRAQNKSGVNDCLYVYLSGMPFSATKEDVRVFFEGIQIDDLIFMRNKFGMFSGCGLVKFRTREDATEGLRRDRKYIGPRYIRVMPASEHQWSKSGGLVQPEGASQRRSRSPIRQRSRSPSNEEFGVLYENLPYSVEKRDIKALLYPVSVTDDQISIFLDDNSGRSKSAIVVFRNLKDYCSGLAHHKETFLHSIVYVSPVSKEKIATILESACNLREDHGRSSRSSERSQKSALDSEKQCIYVRNLPFDVRKVEIMDFFHGFQLSEDRIILLHDDRGAGLGEALVVFQTEKEAMMAQSLNGQRFLGSEVMLKCITWAQMQEFGIDRSSMPERNLQRNSPNFLNDRMYQEKFDSIPDASRYGSGNSGPLDQFENPDGYGQGPSGPQSRQCGPSDQHFNRPTCVRLLNLPSKIMVDEIYDFCYGYRVIPGSVSLQYSRSGAPTGTATVVFESHSEAFTAVQELNGRPIGTRKINVVFV
ncbi:RNA binding motif protein 12Bb isoform 1-T2 [Clarias gariepinus]